ncbi:ATP-dependent helicase [Patescibacteria group bacterium]|nr:ATP-dependent helicase [Patescibacteria group bacterium]MBU1721992.1 ATP-dependent helicase [Patescibacteria group bacterium]MBU1901258.1 ATP-dependent helicase [Patescibacteria group bacterium]
MGTSLNKAQQEAVDHVEGPLLIVAGAGTGKTTVVTKKIAYFIEKKGIAPENILALTFNEKAAAEVTERVDSLVTEGYLDLRIETFHAFCQHILGEYGLDIGLPRDFRVMTQIDAWLLVKQHLYDFALKYYRPMGNPTSHIHALLQHFSKCKDELISTQDYLDYVEGLEGQSDIDSDEIARLSELAGAYHKYNQLLLDNNALDFGDLIFYTVKLLEERPKILEALQERYKYILVDEFQDVNWSQYRLTQLLSAKHGNITVVGDDDQSIYAFRGASVSNIMRFKDDYPKAQEIVLKENYRSAQEILDISYKSIQENNPDRLEIKLGIDKELIAKGSTEKGHVIHLHKQTLQAEAEAVVQEIKDLQKIHPEMTLDDVAILVRANSHVEPFAAALEESGLPYEFIASAGLYRQPIVLDCLNFFKLIDDRYDSTALYRLLHLPCIDIDPHELQQIMYYARRKSMGYYAALKQIGEIHVSKETADQVRKIASIIDSGIRQYKKAKPSELLYTFLDKSGYLPYLVREELQGNREVIRQIFQLKQFFELLQSFEKQHEDATVQSFLVYHAQVIEAGDQGKLFQPKDTPDSINIMTVHGSKGLEYRFVFIVNMVQDRFPARKRGEGISMPAPFIKESLPDGDYHLQEERRLFYVAMTRAKERLYFTSAEDYGGARAKKLSRFLTEIGFVVTNKEELVADGNLPKKKEAPVFNVPVTYTPPKSFSYSQISTYETCPYKYKLGHMVKIPMRGTGNISFGITMHSTLQWLYEQIQERNSVQQTSLFDLAPAPKKTEGEILAPSLDEVMAVYEDKWIDDWYRSERERTEYHDAGKNMIKTLYQSQEGKWNVPIALEKGFTLRVGDYTIRGNIDRVDQLEDGSLEIIDYKTGKTKDSIKGNDKDQLLIYQMAAETLPAYRHLGSVSQLSFYYLRDAIKRTFIGKEKDIEKLREKLIKIIDNIHAGKFDAKPSKHMCGYCDFKDVCDFKLL